ncbi:MAG: tetratricopeptide repeat protein [Saprospiraceae bacterium]|nr:tetratricopeptide repeat protein [Saprospiraceae bacterium]
MRFKCLLIYLLLIPTVCFSESGRLDSLQNLLLNSTDEVRQVELMIQISKEYQYIDIEKAIEVAKEAQAKAKLLSHPELVSRVELQQSENMIIDGVFDQSMELIVDNLERMGANTTSEMKADFLSIAGYTFRRKGNSEKSLESYEKCMEYSKSINYRNGIGQAEKGFGDLNERQGKYKEALGNYERALAIAREVKDIDLEINVLNATGIIYDYQGDAQTALSYYIKAVELAESIGNLVRASKIAGNIGSLHYYIENDAKSAEYYLKAYDLSKATKNKDGQASAAQGIAIVYNRFGKHEEAMKYAQIDLDLRKEMGDVRGLVYAYKNLGTSSRNLNNLYDAQNYYLLGLKYAEETDQKLKIAVMNLNMGRLMNQMERPAEAIPYLKKSIEISKSIQTKREENLAVEDLATSYYKLGNIEKAFEYQKLYSKNETDLLMERNDSETIKMQTAYEAEAKELKIENLEKQTLLQKEIIRKTNLVRNLSLLGGLMLLLVAGLFYNRARIKQKANRLLQEKNLEIEKQSSIIKESLEVKETLLKEIHHRVKNNLQIISSLLNLQSKKITDDSVLSSINEGKNRIEAMSLIHQNLYQTDILTSIDMEKYLHQLMNHLSRSFENESQTIAYSIDADHVSFDIDTAIPIGLIVNELVSNAYKHAFEGRQNGKIDIKIEADENNEYLLSVSDDGIGISSDLDIKKSKSLGLKLVNSLGTKQLKGDLNIENKNGSQIVIKFKDLKAAS